MRTSNWMRRTNASLGYVVLGIIVVLLILAFFFR
jgi:hypothetical protein